jgi:3-oxoacyl-(acyl-carrier-protein) synthase
MKKVYINSVASISAQRTFDNSEFLDDVIFYTETVLPIVNPNYKEFIPPAAARRMAKGVKMGVVASKLALNEAGIENVDAIITGTGMGCVRDSEKFVSGIIDNNEHYLTPTSFIQSTHNTVGGQIALGINCKGYNFTYVHSSVSFESALLDAKLMLACNEASTVLIGGVDELGDHTIKIHRLINHIKQEPVNSLELLCSKTEGAVFSEGANFFVLSNEQQDNTYAEVVSVKTYNTLTDDISELVKSFLKENNLTVNSIGAVVMGNNGDVKHDEYYNKLSQRLFSKTQQLYYKHLCGEFNTASSFGMWLASKILKTQKTPKVVQLNNVQNDNFEYILLYNQYRGENHSLTLLRRC